MTEYLEEVEELLDQVPEPVFVVEDGGSILVANSAASEWYGIEMTGQPLYAVFRQPEVLECIDNARRLQSESKTRVTTVKDGQSTAIELTAGPVAASRLGIEGIVISLRDVSVFEHLDRRRSEFVANVSHELRSPLTSFAGILEMLQAEACDDEETRTKFLRIMEAETRRMTCLVNDLLSLSKVETEELIRPTSPVDIVATAKDAIQSAMPLARSRGTALMLNTSRRRILALGDRPQLAQVVHNLVENALKYGRVNSEAILDCNLLDSAPGFPGRVVNITVSDQGDGIEAFHIPRLTERFYRVDKHRSRDVEGSGLGLAIVKHIVNRHRGRIEIASRLGQGSRFSVLLPAYEDGSEGG